MGPDATSARGIRGFADVRGPWTAVCATLALLVAIGLDGRLRLRTDDATAHHDRVHDESLTAVPFSIGDWLGRNQVSPEGAIALLKPNAIVNRTYENVRTGETASVLFVQCRDARNLDDHYPPVCYPARGMRLVSAHPRDWTVGGTTITGMRYRFAGTGLESQNETVVDNFMVLPKGLFSRDIEDVNRAARNPQLRRLGAAEVQLLTSGTMDDGRRDEVFRTLVGAVMPLVRCAGAEIERE